ncbi:hypothetical protein C0993_000717 [Termitomyces sp. T159_Od127]|nr:hypothetical protein C0993_000717 [Termitomyces sp. T159_Od127]
MTSTDRAGFIVAGLVETILFVASSLGFVGAIVKKQLFVQIYTYFIYVHFILNMAVAGYLCYIVSRFSANADAQACHGAIQDPQGQVQCTGLLKVTRYFYYAIAATVLLVEFYVALAVTRYLNQLKNEKRSARGLRLDNEEAFRLMPKAKIRYSALPDERDLAPNPIYSSYGPDFDPYEDVRGTNQGRFFEHSLTKEENYGGGLWTHSEISSEEKARQQLDDETDPTRDRSVEDSEMRLSTNCNSSPSFPAPQLPADTELPRYTLTDHSTTPVS